MGKTRTLNIVGLLINLGIIACFGVGVYLLYINKASFDWANLKNIDVLTAFVVTFASVIMLIPNIISIKTDRPSTPKLFFSLRFLSAVMGAVTLICLLAFVYPNEADGFKQLFSLTNGTVFFHFVIPVASVFMFMFVEVQKKERFGSTFAPLAFILLYFIGIFIPMFVYVKQGNIDGAVWIAPASFFCVTDDLIKGWERIYGTTLNVSATINIIICVAFFVSTYIIAILLFLFNRLTFTIVVGVEYKDEKTIAKEEAVKEENKEKLTRAQRFKNYIKSEVSFKDVNYSELNHIYHISHHNRKLKTWKVKSEGALRALKVFNTQQEAIDYAKLQVSQHGGSIRIHSVGGAMRRESKWDSINSTDPQIAQAATKTESAPVKEEKPVAKKEVVKPAPAKKAVAPVTKAKAPAKKAAPTKAVAKKPATKAPAKKAKTTKSKR